MVSGVFHSYSIGIPPIKMVFCGRTQASMDKISVDIASAEMREPIRNLYQLYNFDLSEHNGVRGNELGLQSSPLATNSQEVQSRP
jgi:hypothetical protein